MDYKSSAHAIVSCIAEFMNQFNEGTITADHAGRCFENILSENQGRSCLATCIGILEGAANFAEFRDSCRMRKSCR